MFKKSFNYIISFIFIISGLLLIFFPEQSFSNLIYYIGLIMFITGILKLSSAIFTKIYFYPNSSFLTGLFSIIFGLILMNNTMATINAISTIIGLWLCISALSYLISILCFCKTAFDARVFIKNILKLFFGLMIFLTPIISIVFTGLFIGIILIAIGIGRIIFHIVLYPKKYHVKIK